MGSDALVEVRPVPVASLRPGAVVRFRTAPYGRFTVKWQRDGVVMTTDGWLLDLRLHHERDVPALRGRRGHVCVEVEPKQAKELLAADLDLECHADEHDPLRVKARKALASVLEATR